MHLIWYNPDIDRYQIGQPEDFSKQKLKGRLRERFEILFEFNATSKKLAEKVLASLNKNKHSDIKEA